MRLYINTDAIINNALKLKSRLSKLNIELVPVTKGLLSAKEIIGVLKKENFNLFGESRLEQIKNFSNETNFMFLRPSRNREIEDTVKYSRYSLQSSLFTMKHIQDLAKKFKSGHKILIMIDMGDLRDGVYYKNKELLDEILNSIDGNLIAGVATNLGCFGGVIPTRKIIDRFCEVANYINSKNANATIISGGNTTTLPLIENNEISIINQFRVGEAILLGTDVTRNKNISYLEQNTMFLEADLIEVYEKSVQDDDIEFGYDAFGIKKSKTNKAKLKRGIVYMGKIDIVPELTYPIDEDVKIIGSSSDQTVLDLSKSHNNYKIGDSLRFKLGYGSMVKAMASPFVKKIFI